MEQVNLPVARIRLEESGQTLSFAVDVDGRRVVGARLKFDGKPSVQLVAIRLLHAAKPVFYMMPLKVNGWRVVIDTSGEFHRRYGTAIDFVLSVLSRTNDAVARYSRLKPQTAAYGNVLFYNVSEYDRFKGLYETCRRKRPERVLYRNMVSGWDRMKRQWSLKPQYLSLAELFDLIEREQLRCIVSVNMYYLSRMLSEHHLYLPAVLLHAGIEYVMIDYDFYDLSRDGYWQKALFSLEPFARFSMYPHMQKHWDRRHRIRHVHYVSTPQTDGTGRSPRLEENYGILILSHSRIHDLLADLPKVLYVFDHLRETSLYTDLQLWYYALRYLVLRVWPMSDEEREHCNHSLYALFLNCNSMARYIMIDGLRTDRKVDIYGDVGWNSLFPRYYTNQYLTGDEKERLLTGGQYLYLLFNPNSNYMESNPVVSYALNNNVPFVTFPALVKTDEYAGFRHIEYDNAQRLNELIEHMPTLLGRDDLRRSIRICRAMIRDSNAIIQRYVLGRRRIPEDGGMFGKHCAAHNRILDGMIRSYIEHHGSLLEESFERLCLGNPAVIDMTKSGLWRRPLVQTLVRLRQAGLSDGGKP